MVFKSLESVSGGRAGSPVTLCTLPRCAPCAPRMAALCSGREQRRGSRLRRRRRASVLYYPVLSARLVHRLAGVAVLEEGLAQVRAPG